MPIVKARAFRNTNRVVNPDDVNRLVDATWVSVNAFLATLAINNVADVRSSYEQPGKYGGLSLYQVIVFYLE